MASRNLVTAAFAAGSSPAIGRALRSAGRASEARCLKKRVLPGRPAAGCAPPPGRPVPRPRPGWPPAGLPGSTLFFKHLASLARPADRSALPIAGDDPAAKAAVTRFLDAIGYDTVDAGPLGSGGPRFQFGTRAFVAPYGTLSDPRGTPAGAAAIRAALGAG